MDPKVINLVLDDIPFRYWYSTYWYREIYQYRFEFNVKVYIYIQIKFFFSNSKLIYKPQLHIFITCISVHGNY